MIAIQTTRQRDIPPVVTLSRITGGSKGGGSGPSLPKGTTNGTA
jgi:hypothetical protein